MWVRIHVQCFFCVSQQASGFMASSLIFHIINSYLQNLIYICFKLDTCFILREKMVFYRKAPLLLKQRRFSLLAGNQCHRLV